jgi:hypothetical protein
MVVDVYRLAWVPAGHSATCACLNVHAAADQEGLNVLGGQTAHVVSLRDGESLNSGYAPIGHPCVTLASQDVAVELALRNSPLPQPVHPAEVSLK